MPEKPTYKAFCSECGEEFEVSFQPDPNRPIYCRECWENKKRQKSVHRIKWVPEAVNILVGVLFLMLAFGPFIWLFGQAFGDSLTSFVGIVITGLAMVLLVAFEMAGWRNIVLTLVLIADGFLSVIITLSIIRSVGLPSWFIELLTGSGRVIPQVWVLIYGIASAIFVVPTTSATSSFKKIKSGRMRAILALMAVPICTMVASIVAFKIWTAVVPSFFTWALSWLGVPSPDAHGMGLVQWEYELFLGKGPILLIIFGVGLLACFVAGLISIAIVIEIIEALARPKGGEDAIISSGGLQTQKASVNAGGQKEIPPSIPSTFESGDQQISQTDVMCAGCRKHITKSEGQICPTCHKLFCGDCYSSDNHNCRKRTSTSYVV